MNCIVKSYTALCRTDLYCFIMKCTVLHCTALHCTALHCTALHCTVPKSAQKCQESAKKCQICEFYCIGATIRTYWESQCLLYAGFFIVFIYVSIPKKKEDLLIWLTWIDNEISSYLVQLCWALLCVWCLCLYMKKNIFAGKFRNLYFHHNCRLGQWFFKTKRHALVRPRI